MDDAAVRKVLATVRDSLDRKRGVRVSDEALAEMVDLARRLHARPLLPRQGGGPGRAGVVYAMVHKQKAVDVATARESTAAYLGIDLDPSKAIGALAAAIKERELLDPDRASALLDRLGVTLRGIDSRAITADATILLAGPAPAGPRRCPAPAPRPSSAVPRPASRSTSRPCPRTRASRP